MGDSLLKKVANAREALGGPGEVIGGAGDHPRYELFHGANSICSQKVRCVLAHHHLPYVSHQVDMFKGQTYLPDYVRLRMIGCERLGGALASRHGGSTSVSAGGCDGAVVPTLIDWQADEVIVDSRRICLHLDEQMPEAKRLRPQALAEAIDLELAIVDNLPNYQMLMGRQPSASENSATRGSTGSTASQRKIAWCDRYLEEHAGEPILVDAYTAKRAKELSAADELFSPEAMAAAYQHAEMALRGLESKLELNDDPWLFGDRLTLADLFWGIELLRMKNVGVATFWEEGRLPRVEGFAVACEALPAIRDAIIDWPGAIF